MNIFLYIYLLKTLLNYNMKYREKAIWHNGIHLDQEQIMLIKCSDFKRWNSYVYNKKFNFFFIVNFVDINDEEYLCSKTDMELAKKQAVIQDLNLETIEYIKIGPYTSLKY